MSLTFNFHHHNYKQPHNFNENISNGRRFFFPNSISVLFRIFIVAQEICCNSLKLHFCLFQMCDFKKGVTGGNVDTFAFDLTDVVFLPLATLGGGFVFGWCDTLIPFSPSPIYRTIIRSRFVINHLKTKQKKTEKKKDCSYK